MVQRLNKYSEVTLFSRKCAGMRASESATSTDDLDISVLTIDIYGKDNRELAAFLDPLPFQQFVTLTYGSSPAVQIGQDTCSRWRFALEKHHKSVVGAVVSTEAQSGGRHSHHHLLLLC